MTLPYLERTHKRTLVSMLAEAADALIVMEADAVSLVDGRGSLWRSPSGRCARSPYTSPSQKMVSRQQGGPRRGNWS